MLFVLGFSCAQKNTDQLNKVSFDSRDRIFLIDKATELQAGLFPDIANFKEATVYQISDSAYLVLIVSSPKNIKLNLKIEEYKALQTKTDNYLTNRMKPGYKGFTVSNTPVFISPIKQSKNGRPKLIIASTTLSVIGYGALIPHGLGLGQKESAITSLIIVAGGFGVPFISTMHKEVPMAAANLFGGGGGLGLLHGILLFGAVYSPQLRTNYIQDEKNYNLTVASVSLAEALGGYYLGKSGDISTPQSQMIVNNGLTAGVAGLAGSVSLGFFHHDNFKIGLTTSLVSSLAGYYTGYLICNSFNYNEGNAEVHNTIVPLTMLTSYSIAAISNADNQITCGALTLSYPLGILLANKMVENCNFTKPQANAITFTTIGGGLFGLGLAKMIGESSTVKSTALITSLGAIGGFYLTYNKEKKEIESDKTSSILKFDVNPIITPKTDFIPQKVYPALWMAYSF
jgi:hypothetical protein